MLYRVHLAMRGIGTLSKYTRSRWYDKGKLYITLLDYDNYFITYYQGRIQDLKLGGAHLKKLRRVEGGAKIFGVFRVKNHDFTPKNHIFSICGGRRENFWGISCEKSRFYTKKSYFFPILGRGRPPGSAPDYNHAWNL